MCDIIIFVMASIFQLIISPKGTLGCLQFFSRKTHQKMSRWGPVCVTQYKYYGKPLRQLLLYQQITDSSTIPKPCLDAVLQLVVTALVGRGTAFTNFQKTKLCKGGGLMLLSDNEVTGMGHPQILSCAPGISKTTVL